MGVRAAPDDPDAAVGDRGGERARILDHPPPVIPELRAQRLAQAHRLGGQHVRVKAPLHAGEDRGLQTPGELVRAREDDAAAGPAQGLGRGAGHDVGMRHGRGVYAGGHETGDMRHVDQQARPGGAGDCCSASPFDPLESKRINVLSRRSASNLRA